MTTDYQYFRYAVNNEKDDFFMGHLLKLALASPAVCSRDCHRSVAMTYGAACLGLAYHSAFLSTAPGTPSLESEPDNGFIIKMLSSEVARETGGALIMAQAMALCTTIRAAPTQSSGEEGDMPAGSTPSHETGILGVVSAAVAVVGIVLGVFLPGYLQRSGVAVPAHCGGGG